jgi:hypothetical protein
MTSGPDPSAHGADGLVARNDENAEGTQGRAKLSHGQLGVLEIVWCAKCMRAYLEGENRSIGNRLYCPYNGCEGNQLSDQHSWTDLRKKHPTLPVIPTRGAVYPISVAPR